MFPYWFCAVLCCSHVKACFCTWSIRHAKTEGGGWLPSFFLGLKRMAKSELSWAANQTKSGGDRRSFLSYSRSPRPQWYPLQENAAESRSPQFSAGSISVQDLSPILQRGPTELNIGNWSILYAIFSMISLKQHMEYFNFRCFIQLDHPLQWGSVDFTTLG